MQNADHAPFPAPDGRGDGFLSRARLLLGGAKMERLRASAAIVFGAGGVGGWCAEALVRSGFGRVAIVDFDTVCASNVNRQPMATARTVGEPKVEALARRLSEIAPSAEIIPVRARYTEETAPAFRLEEYDFTVDAIDSVGDKVALIRHALSVPETTLLSSMGAARRTDPLAVRATVFRKVEGDGLARALRNAFRKRFGGIPERDWTCVWSAERPRENAEDGGGERANGSLVQVTAVFGMVLASLAVRA